jgi:hypothetical protein
MANHELQNGNYTFNADENPNDGPDNLLTHNFEYDITYDMQNGILSGLGESPSGLNTLKNLKGFDNYYGTVPFVGLSDKKHTVTGNDQANFIIGGSNDDYFYLSAGGDNLNGGNGTDTVDGSKLQGESGISVDLRDEQTINTGDKIFNIENVVGTNNNDILIGDDQDNRLKGAAGRDLLYGYEGNDTLIDKAGDGDMLAGLNGHKDVAEIGDAELTGTFSSPALLALFGIPVGDFLQFTRADGGIVNIHESTETITTDSDSRKWHQWFGDAVQIPDPEAQNIGKAEFTITGTNVVGETLSAKQTASDPDGDGNFIHTWEGSASGNNWSSVGSGSTFLVEGQHEGQQIRLKTEYTDGQDFAESIETEPVKIGSINPVNRLYNTSQGKHLFSSNDLEIDLLTESGWKDEGVIYLAPEEATAEVFRFYVSEENRHFYTALESERDMIVGDQDTFSGWEYEGGAFSAYSTSDFPDGAVAVVRYVNQTSGNHVYSTDTFEQGLLNADSNWFNEGTAWYGDTLSTANDFI